MLKPNPPPVQTSDAVTKRAANSVTAGDSASPTSTAPTPELERLEWTPPSSQPASRPPSVKSKGEPSSRKSSFSKPDVSHIGIQASSNKASSTAGSDHGGQRFTLKDLLASGPKVHRRQSASSRKSDASSDRGGTDAQSTTSLLKKYGVCDRVAIGKGATSVVRLAHKWDRSEEKLYAVKEFRKRRKNETEKEYVKKLTAEFCISSTLHHLNIVETVDLVQDENHNWCEVMEFCPGGDLYAAIKRGGMSPSEVECCFKQIITGIAYIHGQGVAHRDIKPENLYFDTRGHLKIGDYGASTVYRLPWETTVHMSTGLCGSEPYIAPEQFSRQPYDARLVDIWAAGVVYYCLLFQELPWRVAQTSDSFFAAYKAACEGTPWRGPPAPPPQIFPTTISNSSPRAARPLLRRMLEPDPTYRCTIQEVLDHPWMKCIEVCTLVEKPSHQHTNLRAILNQAVLVE
ncbi:kinase-like domain-containing protein [Cantharellus anzutake]|uniref:kinase-like domain-containing protein n=1 Tax=Cantharellus anzutake TaxID=1750568 RepID=UPI001902D998|nr:kinase-like domain-containing protein [Cantharellus anzutake]KAF8334052.1 kinase-like domain-containing protein [Cantharellus anzutake]